MNIKQTVILKMIYKNIKKHIKPVKTSPCRFFRYFLVIFIIFTSLIGLCSSVFAKSSIKQKITNENLEHQHIPDCPVDFTNFSFNWIHSKSYKIQKREIISAKFQTISDESYFQELRCKKYSVLREKDFVECSRQEYYSFEYSELEFLYEHGRFFEIWSVFFGYQQHKKNYFAEIAKMINELDDNESQLYILNLFLKYSMRIFDDNHFSYSEDLKNSYELASDKLSSIYKFTSDIYFYLINLRNSQFNTPIHSENIKLKNMRQNILKNIVGGVCEQLNCILTHQSSSKNCTPIQYSKCYSKYDKIFLCVSLLTTNMEEIEEAFNPRYIFDFRDKNDLSVRKSKFRLGNVEQYLKGITFFLLQKIVKKIRIINKYSMDFKDVSTIMMNYLYGLNTSEHYTRKLNSKSIFFHPLNKEKMEIRIFVLHKFNTRDYALYRVLGILDVNMFVYIKGKNPTFSYQ